MNIQELLTEDMASIDDLAVNIKLGKLLHSVVIYSIDNNDIMGMATFLHYKHDFWIISNVLAKHSFGPLLYSVIAEYIQPTGILIPSESRSKSAIKMWKGFKQNLYVNIVPIEDELGSSGTTFNHSPTKFGIKGNGTLPLQSLIKLDEDFKINSPKEHADIIQKAMTKLKDFFVKYHS